MAKQERKLPDVLEQDFIIADESVNRNGWRLIVEGIDTTSFEKNPVCVVQHNQWMVSVGRWTSLTKQKGTLKGKLLFDRNDEYAVSLYWKYADGFMNAVSLSIVPLTESEEKKDLLPGQRRATITASDLLEVSLVTVPAYGNAVKLCYSDGKEYKASLLTTNLEGNMDKDEKTNEQLQAELQVQKRLSAENLIALHKQRGVVADGEVAPMTELATANYDNVKKMLEARPAPAQASTEQTQANPAETLADALVKLHFDRGAVTEQEKPVYRAAAVADYEGTRKVLEAKPGTQQAKDFVQGLGGSKSQSAGGDDRAGWGYMDWFKKDAKALAAMEKNEPERFKKIVADFQAECEASGIVG